MRTLGVRAWNIALPNRSWRWRRSEAPATPERWWFATCSSASGGRGDGKTIRQSGIRAIRVTAAAARCERETGPRSFEPVAGAVEFRGPSRSKNALPNVWSTKVANCWARLSFGRATFIGVCPTCDWWGHPSSAPSGHGHDRGSRRMVACRWGGGAVSCRSHAPRMSPAPNVVVIPHSA